MFKSLFNKKEKPKEEIVLAPLSGKVIPLEDVPDPVFSQRMMGEGIAIEPTDGKVVAPFAGEIIQVFPTKHAVGLRGASGLQILIHIGLETVMLKGEGFESFVEQGDRVEAGETVVIFDRDIIQEKASSMITPIIMTNGDLIETFHITEETSVREGESNLIKVRLK